MMTYDQWKAIKDEGERPADPGIYPGLHPMSEAPHVDYMAPITAVLIDYDEGTDPRVKVFYSDQDKFWTGQDVWFDASGDGAEDSIWRHWDTEEFAGWLP